MIFADLDRGQFATPEGLPCDHNWLSDSINGAIRLKNGRGRTVLLSVRKRAGLTYALVAALSGLNRNTVNRSYCGLGGTHSSFGRSRR